MPHLQRCGYTRPLLRENFRFAQGQVPLVAFAHEPADARSACIAVTTGNGDPARSVLASRETGAPIVFVTRNRGFEWWAQRHDGPQHLEDVPAAGLGRFFARYKDQFRPERVYAAKTRGLFEKDCQLTFVDVGLMPMVEGEIGRRLTSLVERSVRLLMAHLKWSRPSAEQGHWIWRSVFWLVAAKILHDKNVPSFSTLDLRDVDQVFISIDRHYASHSSVGVPDPERARALADVAPTVAQFADLGHVTTESLAYVYENALISKQTRAELGTHSTPSYLVDYIVWQLAPWIEKIPQADRYVFEPACGHAAFLVSAMRLLREILSSDLRSPQARHGYLKGRLHGIDSDSFALEIARLSLTLADIPNPNGWDLTAQDMFTGDLLAQRAKQAMILLANPPFERFKAQERSRYADLKHVTKTAEMLARTLPHLAPGAVFGVVIPQGILHSKDAAPLRHLLANDFELQEICLFPDGIFKFSDMESAVIVGRRRTKRSPIYPTVRYRRVREKDADRFKESYAVTTERLVSQERFAQDAAYEMHLPDLEEVWRWTAYGARLGDVAHVGQGLFYRGRDLLPDGTMTISVHHFARAARGFAQWHRDVMIHELPREVWMSLDPAVVDRSVTGGTTGVAQVLVNYAPVSRGPWRLKALIDREGHAVTSRFLTVRPKSADHPLEFVWAILNSPLANAYVYSHTMKRDILAGTLREMPLPRVTGTDTARIAEAARAYLGAVRPSSAVLAPGGDEPVASHLLMQMDAEVLRLYDLPPRLERQILDLFARWRREGVPFKFDRYFPENFEPCFCLHEYLSEEFQRSTAGELRKRFEPLKSGALLKALRRATEDFGE